VEAIFDRLEGRATQQLNVRDVIELCGDARVALLLRATKCAGVKLSQSAYEMCQNATSLSAMELFFLQTSWNILKRPTEALVRLFGIPLSDGQWDENSLRLINEAAA